MKKIKICVPITEKTTDKVLEKMQKSAEKGADLQEIWLSEIKNLDLETIFKNKKLPLVFNLKNEKEKGAFRGTDREKVDILLKTVELGAEYIDIAFESSDQVIAELVNKKGKSQLIISHHYWNNTPPLPALLNLVKNMLKKGADIVKIACTPKDKKDLITILRLAENLDRKKIKHITILMSDIGKPSRFLIPVYFNGEFTFAPIEASEKTAPGQLTIEEIKKIEKNLIN